jgi:DNA-binding GntR family transcriptional regulator
MTPEDLHARIGRTASMLRQIHLQGEAIAAGAAERLEAVNARLQALRFRSNQDDVKWGRAAKEHEEMIEALAAHDSAAMREVLLLHLREKRDVVIAQLRREAGSSASGTAR